MANNTSGGLPVETEDTPTTGGLQGTSSINIGGQKISTKGPIAGQALLDAMQEEYARRVPDSNLGRFNTFLEGMKDAVAITSRDPGSAMAARDQEKRLRDESLFQMRSQMAALKGQMGQQAQTNAMMTGADQAGTTQGAAPSAAPGGASAAQQMINSLPPSLQGRGRQLAAEGNWDALAKLAQETEIHRPELEKQMAYIDRLPEGEQKTRLMRQVLEKSYAPAKYYNEQGEETTYTVGGPNDPTVASKPAVTPAPVVQPAPAPVAAAPKPAPAPVAAAPAPVAAAPKPAVVAPVVAPNPALASVAGPGIAAFTPKPVVAGKSDDTGLPNTATPGTVPYNEQRAKNMQTATELQKSAAQAQINVGEHSAKSAIDVAAEAGKASNKIYGEEYAKVPLEKERAVNTIQAADRVIKMADDPMMKQLMGYYNGGNKAASTLIGVLNNLPGQLFDKDKMESAMSALNFTPAQRTAFQQLKTDSAALGIEYTANMFKGARLGIGLEKLGSTGKGVSADFTPETNKLFAQVTKNNSQFVLEGHRTFRDQWLPAHPGKTWGDFIQSREYDGMLDKHLESQKALTQGTPIKIQKLSSETAIDAAKKGIQPEGSIMSKYKIKKSQD